MTKRTWLYILGVGGLLAAALTTRSHNPQTVQAQAGCTQADVQGTYGFQFAGSVLAAPEGPFVPFAESGRWIVDDQGHYSGSSAFSFGGQYFEHTFTGTVQVRPDCTAISVVPRDSLGFTNLVAYWVILKPHESILLTSETGVSAVNGRAERLGAGSQTDRIETMLRDVGRALGLAFPRA